MEYCEEKGVRCAKFSLPEMMEITAESLVRQLTEKGFIMAGGPSLSVIRDMEDGGTIYKQRISDAEETPA